MPSRCATVDSTSITARLVTRNRKIRFIYVFQKSAREWDIGAPEAKFKAP
jgi:hypothetical protein